LRACAALGISVQPSRPYTGSDDSMIERTFGSMNTLFCQHVAGYAGRDTTRRGPGAAEEAIWTVAQLQELFDEWVVACWQSRRHEGLSHTWGEGRDLSPNEMYATCVAISGYVPLPLTGDDYIELLPAALRTVNDYGLTIDNRTYDCKALNPYRRLDSGRNLSSQVRHQATCVLCGELSGLLIHAWAGISRGRGGWRNRSGCAW
jgi:hypothetical protein